MGGTGDSRRAADSGESRLQAADDEAVRLPAYLGDVCGEGGGELYTVGRLSGELHLLQ